MKMFRQHRIHARVSERILGDVDQSRIIGYA
jgi:hypothetical protein